MVLNGDLEYLNPRPFFLNEAFEVHAGPLSNARCKAPRGCSLSFGSLEMFLLFFLVCCFLLLFFACCFFFVFLMCFLLLGGRFVFVGGAFAFFLFLEVLVVFVLLVVFFFGGGGEGCLLVLGFFGLSFFLERGLQFCWW